MDHTPTEPITLAYLVKAVCADDYQLHRAVTVSELGEMEFLQGVVDLAPQIEAALDDFHRRGGIWEGVFAYDVVESGVGPKVLAYALRRLELPCPDVVRVWAGLAIDPAFPLPRTVCIQGSHGEVTVDRWTGLPERVEPVNSIYNDADRFAVDEIMDFADREVIDILDVSYHTVDGVKVPSSAKRARCREALGSA